MRFSSLVDRLEGPGAEAWDIHYAASAAQSRGEDVIMLSIGDPDFATPEFIIERAVEALRSGDTHYADICGKYQLRAEIAALHVRHTGQQVTADNVIVLAGAQNGLFASALCLLEAGDEVIVFDPVYVTYEPTIAMTGASLVRVACPPDKGFRPDLQAIRDAVTPRTKAIFFANPNNPTGVVLNEHELKAIADIANANDLWVVTDEVYESLCFEGSHISIATFPGMAERTISASSLSKSHAMTGWRAGWAIAPTTVIKHMENLALNMLYGLPGFIQEAALVAVKSYDHVTNEMREIYRRRRDLVLQSLADCDLIEVVKPEAGMFVLLDVRKVRARSVDFCWDLLKATGISVLDAAAFGPAGEGFVRLSFTMGEEQLADACNRLKKFVQQSHA